MLSKCDAEIIERWYGESMIVNLYYTGDKYIMDLYLVGPASENVMEVVTGEIKANMLFNYIVGKKAADKYEEKIKPGKLFIDSGAFSAWTRGEQIDVDEYINWINERADFIDLYGQVDTIPGDKIKGHTQEQVEEAARATWENYLYMTEDEKKPWSIILSSWRTVRRFMYEWTDEDGKTSYIWYWWHGRKSIWRSSRDY